MELLLSFVYAFLVCGILSALFQAVMMITKLKPPTVLVIGFALGALLVPLGAMGYLESVGGAGMFITVMGAGGAACSGLLELFSGNAVPFATTLFVFISLLVLGIIAGMIRNKTATPKSE